MAHPSPRLRSAIGITLKLFFSVLFLLSACRQPLPVSDDVRSLFQSREIQPRLTGFKFSACKSTHDLIPRATCQSDSDKLDRNLRASVRGKIRGALNSTPTAELFHAEALFTIASSPENPTALLNTSARLREALAGELLSQNRAAILSDLAATHLVLAELLQSHLEIAASAEYALWALEEDPALSEAKFNLQLSFLLLGLEKIDDSTSDPWLEELYGRLQETQQSSAPSLCPPSSRIRLILDGWSKKPTVPPEIDLSCFQSFSDRYWPDLIQQTGSLPIETARVWQIYRSAVSSLSRFDSKAAGEYLEELQRFKPPLPIDLEAAWIHATLLYQSSSHLECQLLAQNLANRAEAHSYLELAARTNHLAALSLQVSGNYASAIRHLKLASDLAQRAGSRHLDGAVKTLLVEQLELFGREEDAWTEIAITLRSLDIDTISPRILCLHSAARLAMQRGFHRLALLAHQKAISIGKIAGGVNLVIAFKSRGECLALLGHHDEARRDLQAATAVMETAEASPDIAVSIRADLEYLNSLAAKTADLRRDAAKRASDSFHSQNYVQRYAEARHSLARALIDLGALDEAGRNLEAALAELSQITTKVEWVEATALVQSARPLTDALIGLQIEKGRAEEIQKTVGAYFGLRTGTKPQPIAATLGQRLVYFVREQETIILFEGRRGMQLRRSPMGRSELKRLREALLLQIRAGATELDIHKTTSLLTAGLIEPIAELLQQGDPLAIVVDDVLAGIPFVLLPFREGLMIDSFAVAYATDLRQLPGEIRWGRRPLILGSAALEGNLSQLNEVENEATDIGSTYDSAQVLIGSDATAARLQPELSVPHDVLHFAGHFIINYRSPLNSYFLLNGAGEEPAFRLSIKELLQHPSPATEQLIYMSGCDTGRGLPPTATGINSLAQAFTSLGFQAILSLWQLDDRFGYQLATTFHRNLSQGKSPAQSLREAQLALREERPDKWAPLAFYY